MNDILYNIMVSIAMTVGSAIVNAVAFTGSSYLFNKLRDDDEKASLKLQEERDAWTKARTERIDFINEELARQDHAAQTFKDVDEAMEAYYEATGEDLPPLSDYPQLEDFLDDDQNATSRISFAFGGTLYNRLSNF